MTLFSGVKQTFWSWDYSQGLDYQDFRIIRHQDMVILLHMQMNTSGYSTTKESWQHQPLMHHVDVHVHPTHLRQWVGHDSISACVTAIPFFPQDLHIM
jgi:hypothetical protein